MSFNPEVEAAQRKLEQMRRERCISALTLPAQTHTPVIAKLEAAAPAKALEVLKEESAIELFGEEIESKDIAYVHSLFLQCFLPLRHTAKNRDIWQVSNGRATIAMTAGYGVDPTHPDKLKKYETPAGSMGNMVVTYTLDYIRRNDTPLVDLGDSLRECMEQLKVPIAGTTGKALAREVLNFANADIVLGLWTPEGDAYQRKAAVTKSLSFWLDKDDRQRTL